MKSCETSMSNASTNSWCLYLYPIFRDPCGYLPSVHRQPRFLVSVTLWLRDVPSKHQAASRSFLKCVRPHNPIKHTLEHLHTNNRAWMDVMPLLQSRLSVKKKILLMADVLEMHSAGRAWHNLVTSNQRHVIRDQGAEGSSWEGSFFGFITPTCRKKKW